MWFLCAEFWVTTFKHLLWTQVLAGSPSWELSTLSTYTPWQNFQVWHHQDCTFGGGSSEAWSDWQLIRKGPQRESEREKLVERQAWKTNLGLTGPSGDKQKPTAPRSWNEQNKAMFTQILISIPHALNRAGCFPCNTYVPKKPSSCHGGSCNYKNQEERGWVWLELLGKKESGGPKREARQITETPIRHLHKKIL